MKTAMTFASARSCVETSAEPRTLNHLFSADFAYCRDKFLLDTPEGDCVACSDLADPQVFGPIVDRYAAAYGGADRRAAASLWTMYYFSGLVIGPTIAWRAHGRVLPLSLECTHLCLDPQTGAPSAFVLKHEGLDLAGMSLSRALEHAIFSHAAPLIEGISAGTGLSKKVLWSNLAVYLDWIIRESAEHLGTAAGDELALVEAARWPDGRTNPLAGLTRRECGHDGDFTRRRVCCLRYILPTVPGCGMVCPLPAGRA